MLSAVIGQLEQLIDQVKASGPVADADARLDISTHSTSGYQYARLRNGRELKACGRVGSETYRDVLATLQRRDMIAQLQQAIAALKQADAIPLADSAVGKEDAMASNTTSPAAKPKAKTKTKPQPPTTRTKKTTGRKQLYTHVKTKQGSVVHAVLGKDKTGEWRTPALCGATPPQRDPMGWEFPTHDDGVTCSKCYRKLPGNGKRYLPVL